MAYDRAYYMANREKLRAYQRAWRSMNRDKVRASANASARTKRALDVERARARDRAYYAMNRDRILPLSNANARRRRTGFSPKMFERIWAEQDGRCAVCRGPLRRGKDAHADHDHMTGSPRGILHSRCNTGLGMFNDDADVLRRAADYIESHRAAIQRIA